MKKSLLLVMALLMMSVMVLAGCQSTGPSDVTVGEQDNPMATEAPAEEPAATEAPAEAPAEEPAEAPAEEPATEEPAAAVDVSEIAKTFDVTPLESISDPAIFPLTNSIGPNGEKGVGISELLKLFKPEDLQKVKDAKLKGAICMHTTAADFSILQMEGIKSVYKTFGIELLTTTDAEFDVAKSVTDFESTMALKPDIIVDFILEPASNLPLLKKAHEQGIVVSLIDSIPTGINPEEFAGAAMADNYANGYNSAKFLAEYLGGKGKVAMINYQQDLFHTNQRTFGGRDAFKEYPDIEVVAEQQFDGTVDMAASVTEQFITQYPDLGGIWTVWDMPGMAAAGVIENAGKQDITKVVTIDLSEDSGLNVAQGGALICICAQHPYDQGIAEGLQAIGQWLGYDVPKYVMVPGEMFSRESYDQFAAGWKRVYHKDIPAEFKTAFEKK